MDAARNTATSSHYTPEADPFRTSLDAWRVVAM